MAFLSHIFLLFFLWDYCFWGKKSEKHRDWRSASNLLYGYLSQQQHFIANPPLLALFKKGAGSFPQFLQVPGCVHIIEDGNPSVTHL
jgi:hypothetical protein